MPLYQAVFSCAHDEHGAALIHLPSLSLGLAGAAVLDLVLDKRLALHGGQASALLDEPFGDLVTDTLIRTLGRDRAQRPLAFWLRAGAVGMYAQVAHVMTTSGQLTVSSSSHRKLGVVRRHVQVLLPSDPVTPARMQTDLLHVFYGRRSGEPAWAALCGLIAVLRLERTLDLEMGTHAKLARLRRIADTQFPDCTAVLTAIEDLLGETAIAALR
jgi:hypothetical protein